MTMMVPATAAVVTNTAIATVTTCNRFISYRYSYNPNPKHGMSLLSSHYSCHYFNKMVQVRTSLYSTKSYHDHDHNAMEDDADAESIWPTKQSLSEMEVQRLNFVRKELNGVSIDIVTTWCMDGLVQPMHILNLSINV